MEKKIEKSRGNSKQATPEKSKQITQLEQEKRRIQTCCWILAKSAGDMRLICSWASLMNSGSIIFIFSQSRFPSDQTDRIPKPDFSSPFVFQKQLILQPPIPRLRLAQIRYRKLKLQIFSGNSSNSYEYLYIYLFIYREEE